MPTVIVNGVSLAYDLSGPSRAPVVAFSNSLGSTRAMWDGVLPHLRGRYRTLTYDTRGHGESATLDAPVEMADLAADLAGLLDALGIAAAHVVGLSMGGMTAQKLAIDRPERVLSLTLMATSALLPSPEMWAERAELVRREGLAAIADVTMGRWFTPSFTPGPWRERLLAIDPVGYAVGCGAVGRMDLRPEIGRITAPTLVVAGRDDPSTTLPMMEALASGIPGADLVVLANARHLFAIERPDAVAAHLLAFLDRQPAVATLSGAATFDEGIANRRAVLGAAHVDRSLAAAGPFAGPWQDVIARAAWGEVWGDPRLTWKTRSIVTLAMMVALHREEEFKLHLRPALGNGLTLDELQALLLQTAIYGGVPAANAAFRWVRDVLGDELDRPRG